MDSGRSLAGEQEFREPKRKKKIPGVIPNNPFPIIFWKKLGIPPCTDLWPCYNGLYDGEGVVFPSSEDISDIHSMGYFGRNVFEERGRDSCVRGIPLFRERQWKKMVKWAADSGYVITEQDDTEDDKKDNTGSAEKEGKEEEPSSKKRSSKEGNTDRKGFDLEKEDTAAEFDSISEDEDIIITSEEKVEVPEKSDIGNSGHQQTPGEEIKERSSSEEESKEGELRVEESKGESDVVKGNDARKESGSEEDQERCKREAETKEEGNNEEEKEVMEVVEEVSSEVNAEIKKIDKEEDSILNGVKSEKANKSDIGEVVVKDEVSTVPINSEKGNSNSETKIDAKDSAFVKESQEKGKICNSDDFVEIIEETSTTEASEYANKNNGESLKKRKLKRRFEDESCNDRDKRTKKDASKCEDGVILGGSSGDCTRKTLDDVGKFSDGVLNSSGECEIVEINDRKTSGSGEWGGKRENSETDDDVIVVSVDDGDHSLDYAPGRCRRLLSDRSPKDMALPLGKRQKQAIGNDTGRNTYNKYNFMKKNENDMIEIDLHEKEMLEGKPDLSKSDDVEDLYQKRNGFRNCDDKTKDEKGSTAGSLKSDGEVSPCIVIPDSDSEDEAERGPQWESDPSVLLPSLEWLKLFPEEAFFLAYALGCVQVWDARKTEVEDAVVKVKEKKRLEHYPSSVDSKSKEDDSVNSAISPRNLKNSDDTLPIVPSSDEAKGTVSMVTSSILSDRETAGCDKKVQDEKKNTLSDEMERNVLATDAVNGYDRSSLGKPIDNGSCALSVSEEKCSSDSSGVNGSITVIDLVDSPPSNRHLVDKESSANDDVDPAAECTGGKPESMFNFHHKAMSLEELWNTFRLSRASQSSIPFETSYAVYHHFRSKGWVVKPGIRFGGDFLLYKDGPSFYHASYLVVIDSSLPHEGSSVTWNTLAGLNRLAENVAKELMICRVEWPETMMESQLWSPKCLDGLTVEEILVKRWVSMKERDADEEVSEDDKNFDFIPLAL